MEPTTPRSGARDASPDEGTERGSALGTADVLAGAGATDPADGLGGALALGGAATLGEPAVPGKPGQARVPVGAAGTLRGLRRAPGPTVTVTGPAARPARGAGSTTPTPAGAPRRLVADDVEWDTAVRAVRAGHPDELRERPGPALPGWCAVLVGVAALVAGAASLWWAGALPAGAAEAVRLPARDTATPPPWVWAAVAVAGSVALLAFGGLTRGRVGSAWVLSAFGRYRGSVRRTGLVWISPLVLRRRVDVRLRHWRSEPMPAVDARGVELRAVVLVVWRVRDTARAVLSVDDHVSYLREQVEATLARVLSRLPADAYGEARGTAAGGGPATLRDAQAVGDALTRTLAARCEPVGLTVYSAQPVSLAYAPEVAAAMQRSQLAALDARHRDSVLTSVVDAVDETVNRLTNRGLVELDDYERKALVKDLTVAFYTARGPAPEHR